MLVSTGGPVTLIALNVSVQMEHVEYLMASSFVHAARMSQHTRVAEGLEQPKKKDCFADMGFLIGE